MRNLRSFETFLAEFAMGCSFHTASFKRTFVAMVMPCSTPDSLLFPVAFPSALSIEFSFSGHRIFSSPDFF